MSQLRLDQLVVDIPYQQSGFALDVTIEPGQVWGVLGPNGVGKTTLLHTLAGLRNARSGQVVLDDVPLTQMSRGAIAQQIGIMFQEHQDGFPATVAETVMLGRHPHLSMWQSEQGDDRQLVEEALKALELSYLSQRQIYQLSGGERQRVALAMLLAQQPDIWLVDEPTNHLDLHHQVSAMALLQRQGKQQRCVIASLHDVNLASQWCTHVLLMYPDRAPLWGEARTLLQLTNLEALYQQPLAVAEVDGRPIFVPRVAQD
ncbi:ABC transporter ATP-binding protein [Maribrevibacterium harenarium]|uniref:ABC transporter ATP-binding protein n=1 Tax=Maribrevibacterium harenarium TaxID=2589817 RepID=A0A501WH19_9GAMM|nr:ABC transporter ATP-binding protein [Maribrevibacterium harenarium]TPE49173.1 ABC transporter ATP-binding protein [Maribrevibacterium harenarium]